MKKIFKNKSIKILITSLLCGLTFTYINAGAMESSEQKQSQESNSKSNTTFDFKNATNMQSNFEEAAIAQKLSSKTYNSNLIEDLEDKIKKIQKYLDMEYFDMASFFVDTTYKFLKENTEYMDENTKNNYENKAKNLKEKIKLEFIKNLEDKIKEIQEYNNSKNFFWASEKLNDMYKFLEKNKTYTDKNFINEYKNKVKDLREKIKENRKKEIIENINTTYEYAIDYINHGDLDFARDKLNEIIKDKKINSLYLNMKDFEKINEKIENLKEKIKLEFIKNLEDKIKEIQEYNNSKNFFWASEKLNDMYKFLEKNKTYTDKNFINEYKNKVKDLREKIKENRKKEIIENINTTYEYAIDYINHGDLDFARDKLNEIIKDKKINSLYLNMKDFEKINEKIENLNRKIAIKKMNENYKEANKKIYNDDFNGALNIIEKIISDKETYSSYLNEENKKEIEEKINELKNNIENRKKAVSIKKRLESIYDDATKLVNSGNIGLLPQKIGILKNELRNNKQCLNDDEIINIENQIRELEGIFESREENIKMQMKKQS